MSRLILILLIAASALFGQDRLESEINSNRRELDKLKSRIKTLKSKIYTAEKEARSLLEQINDLEKEISIVSEIKRLLEKENKLLARKIRQTREQLADNRAQLAKLRDQYARRVLYTYKYGKIKNLELLFTSASLNQAMVRYKYLKIFAEQERRVINGIRTKIQQISALEADLNTQFSRQKKTLAEKDEEEARFQALKNEKDAKVRNIRWNEKTYAQQLERAENEYEKLYQIIVALEKQRKLRESSPEPVESFALPLKNFRETRGKLPWPVRGKVITKYGKQRHQELKTYVKNTGIDIKVNTGTEVHAVFQGLVSMITYLAGYGNTVILDHGEGYYSVYSHLDEVLVNKDQYLTPGEVLGLAGSTGSLEGAKLHFEIYENQKTVDPQKWLR